MQSTPAHTCVYTCANYSHNRGEKHSLTEQGSLESEKSTEVYIIELTPKSFKRVSSSAKCKKCHSGLLMIL